MPRVQGTRAGELVAPGRVAVRCLPVVVDREPFPAPARHSPLRLRAGPGRAASRLRRVLVLIIFRSLALRRSLLDPPAPPSPHPWGVPRRPALAGPAPVERESRITLRPVTGYAGMPARLVPQALDPGAVGGHAVTAARSSAPGRTPRQTGARRGATRRFWACSSVPGAELVLSGDSTAAHGALWWSGPVSDLGGQTLKADGPSG